MLENLESFVLNQYEFDGEAVGVCSFGAAMNAVVKYVGKYQSLGVTNPVFYTKPDIPLVLLGAVMNSGAKIQTYDTINSFDDVKGQFVLLDQADAIRLDKKDTMEMDQFVVGHAEPNDINQDALKYYDFFIIEYKHGAVVLCNNIEQGIGLKSLVGTGYIEIPDSEQIEFRHCGLDVSMNNVSAAAILDSLTHQKPKVVRNYAVLQEALKDVGET